MTLCPQLRRLVAEHARWVSALQRGAGAEPAERAARLLALWDAEILPRCRAEEEVLLPELARRLSEADATVVFTLGDHVVLRRLVRELRSSEPEERGAALGELERRLAEHAAFEERTLFPVLQETIGCAGLAALATEMGAARKERQRGLADRPQAGQEALKARKGRKP